MIAVFVSISGPTGTSTDELINNGREAFASIGHQVGDFTLEQEVAPGSIVGTLEVPDELAVLAVTTGWECSWNDCTITADAP
jgi:hypothetical protein